METSKTPPGTTSHDSNCGDDDVNNDEQSPFLRLPRKVRDKIYRLLLVKSTPLIAVDPDLLVATRLKTAQSHYNPRTKTRATTFTTSINDPSKPQILRVCKQVFEEAQKILYMENVFSFCISTDSREPFDKVTRSRINVLQWAPKIRIKVKITAGWDRYIPETPYIHPAEDDSQIPLLDFLSSHPWLEDLTIEFHIEEDNTRRSYHQQPTIRLPHNFWVQVYPLRNLRNIDNISLVKR